MYYGVDGSVTALHSNGTLDWTYPTTTDFSPSVALGTNGTVYVNGYILTALTPTGIHLWDATVNLPDVIAHVGNGIALAPNGTIYIPLKGGVAAFTANGALLWQIYPTACGCSPPSVGPDGAVYLVLANALEILNPDGTVRQIITPTTGLAAAQPAIGANGLVYLPGFNYSVLTAFGPP